MNKPLVFGSFSLNAKEASLRRGSENVLLPPKAFAVLCYLAEKPGLLVTKNDLIEAVWPRGYVDEAVLKACINEIRKALGDDPKSPRYIETVFKHGYRFIAQIELNQFTATSQIGYSIHDITALFDWSPVSQQEDAFRVGRQNVLNHLDVTFASVFNHQRKLVFLTGEAGIGKSTVIDMFLDRVADKDIGLLHGQCIDHYGSGEAYLPLLDALARPCRLPNAKPLVDKIKDIAPTWVEQMPWLLSTEEKREIRRETLGATKERMLREFCELIEHLSLLRPLILILEDLHWSDFSTIDFLTLFAKRREPTAVLIIGTYRPLEVKLKDHPVVKIQNDLQIKQLCVSFSMDSLEVGDIEEYLNRRFECPEFGKMLAASVIRRSEGNPLFMVNLIDNIVNQGGIVKIEGDWVLSARFSEIEGSLPDNLRDMINLQIDHLNPQEQWLLRVASVAGIEFSVAVISDVLGQNPFQIDFICTELVRRGEMLNQAEDEIFPDGSVVTKYAFKHALYSEALYEQLSSSQRHNLHNAVGMALEKIYDQHNERIAAEIAKHFEEAMCFNKAISYFAKAAIDAARYSANNEALLYLNRAMGQIDKLHGEERINLEIEVLRQRVRLGQSMFNIDQAKVDAEKLIEIANIQNLLELKVLSLVQLASVNFWRDRQKIIPLIELGVELAKKIENNHIRVQTECSISYWKIQLAGWNETDAKKCQIGLDDARSYGDMRLLGIRLCHLAAVNCYNARYSIALKLVEESMKVLLDIGDENYYYMVDQHYNAWANLHLGHLGIAHDILTNYIRIANKNGNPAGINTATSCLSFVYIEFCQFEEAYELLKGIMKSSISLQDVTSYCLGTLMLGRCLLNHGDYQNAFNCFDEIHQMTRDQGILMESPFYLFLHRGFTEYWYLQGNYEEARKSAMTLCDLANGTGEITYLSIGYAWLAEIYFKTNNKDSCIINIQIAIDSMGGEYLSYPLAAWRVFAKAAEYYELLGDREKAIIYRDISAEVISLLADSLNEHPEYKSEFLSSPQVQLALGNSESTPISVSIL